MSLETYKERYRYARDPSALLCTGLCRRRKPRSEFRETPWHGRAAECNYCESFGRDCGAEWSERVWAARQSWLLEQERQRTRMLRRHIERLRADPWPLYRRRYVMAIVQEEEEE